MWQLLLKMLEGLGRLRWPTFSFRKRGVIVGQSQSSDYLGGLDWSALAQPRTLAAVWGPAEESPWRPFHCITLFAALDRIERSKVGPLTADPLALESFKAPSWLGPGVLLFVDLKGVESVAFGAALAVAEPCELVATFNNWPDARGILKPEQILAALLRYAAWLEKKRRQPEAASPVAWLCDSDRLRHPSGRPGEFDNRYYLDDSLLPGPKILKSQGIRQIVYVHTEDQRCSADLISYFGMLKQQGWEVGAIEFDRWERGETPIPLPLPQAPFFKGGFFRSSAGGFGGTVPHPSSGG